MLRKAALRLPAQSRNTTRDHVAVISGADRRRAATKQPGAGDHCPGSLEQQESDLGVDGRIDGEDARTHEVEDEIRG